MNGQVCDLRMSWVLSTQLFFSTSCSRSRPKPRFKFSKATITIAIIRAYTGTMKAQSVLSRNRGRISSPCSLTYRDVTMNRLIWNPAQLPNPMPTRAMKMCSMVKRLTNWGRLRPIALRALISTRARPAKEIR